MSLGKTIQIYLPDGNPRGLKIAEITSRTVQALLVPRSMLEFAAKRDELSNVGIYFLVGNRDSDSLSSVYIGEAEDCLNRLRQHNRTNDFWSQAIVIISKTQYFTKTHVKFLESYSYEKAKKTGRFEIANSTVPTTPFTPESIQADLIDNFDTVKILVSTLGFPLFDEIKVPEKKNVIYCRGKLAKAEGEYTEDGLIVFEGSTANLVPTKTAGKWVNNIREKLTAQGILKQTGDVYQFTKNYIFSSPSAASGCILARRSNGWVEWKYKNGKTLDEAKRQNI